MLPQKSEARREMAHVEPRPLTETTEQAGPPVAMPPPRDLASELRAKAGDIPSCVAPNELDALPSRVEVDVDAVVTGSGVISRVEVRSAQLSRTAIACLQARVGGARFTAPVPDAPRHVTTTLVLERRPPPTAPVAP